MYNDVLTILVNRFGWPANLKPHQTPVDEMLAAGHTADQVATTLELFCRNVGGSIVPPWGFTGTGYEWVRYDYNKGGEYWEYYTRLELGLAVEPPVDKKSEAQSVSEWFSNLSINRTRQGYILLDPTPEGSAEAERRRERSNFCPPEWGSAGKVDIWRLAVLEGYIKTTLDPFSAAYASNTPSLDSIRKLDAQQWLDNLRTKDAGKPVKWLEDGTLNPEFAGF